MNYEDAFQALKDGDFKLAVPLLEQAARESAYSTEAVNHAYTLALYHAGAKTRLADAAFEIGDSLLETNPALALDYFQRALLGGLDAACVRYIGEVFEGWAAPKPPRASPGVKTAGEVSKVAHVVGCLNVNHAPARHVSMLVKSLRQHGVESQVFTTEWAASWFFNGGHAPQSESLDLVPGAIVASVEGDFIERAERIASAIRASGAQVVFYHAGLEEQITTRVAAFRPKAIQVNVAHGLEMEPALFDGYIHLTRQGMASSHHSSAPREWMPSASDIVERVKACPPDMRHAMGLEAAATVSATLGNLRSVSDPAYLNTLIGLLRLFPNHFHLFAGAGDVKAIRGALHTEGVLPRVRFLGTLSDVASVMAVTDIYLAPTINSEDVSIVEAMGAGRPPVVFRNPADPGLNSAAELLGVPELIARNEAEYSQIAQGLLRDAKTRSRCADLVRAQFESEFAPALLGPRYLQFLERIR